MRYQLSVSEMNMTTMMCMCMRSMMQMCSFVRRDSIGQLLAKIDASVWSGRECVRFFDVINY